ncbi:TPA: hypothetical protein ACSPZY_002222 [Aeromonas veronii]
MTERPVIFNGEMVRAILAGRKTQTRRIMKPQPEAMPDKPGEYWWPAKRFESMLQLSYFNDPVTKELAADACPFGGIGDRLWVKETFAPGLCTKSAIAYRATHKPSDLDEGWDEQIKWTPSIYMSRSFSRIKLEITDVRVERLNDINEQDALAEGMDDGTSPAAIAAGWFEKPRRAFRRLWERIYGQESWDSNPWVWVAEFKQVQS